DVPPEACSVPYAVNNIIVTKSANTATNNMNCPIVVRIIFISFSVGTTTPNEIVEIIIIINKTSSIKTNHLNTYANTIKITKIKKNTLSANSKYHSYSLLSFNY